MGYGDGNASQDGLATFQSIRYIRSRDVRHTSKGVRAPGRERAASALQIVRYDKSYRPSFITDRIAYTQ